jgi:hypothetical protein
LKRVSCFNDTPHGMPWRINYIYAAAVKNLLKEPIIIFILFPPFLIIKLKKLDDCHITIVESDKVRRKSY